MNQILKLTIFLTLCCVVRGQCDGLTVYNDGIKMNTSAVCIRQFKTAETIDFCESFNQSLLPPEFPISNTSVQGPSHIHVRGIETPLVHNSVDYMYPGLSIHWRPALTVFGLEFKENEQTFVSTRIETSIAYKTGTPTDWQPFVAYNILNNGTIKVTFSLPPPEFNITAFDVYLNDRDANLVDTVNVCSGLKTEGNTEFSLPLTARRSDYYYVVVWAKDKFPLQQGLCQCWAWQNGLKTCKATCGGTKTSYFYVNITIKGWIRLLLHRYKPSKDVGDLISKTASML